MLRSRLTDLFGLEYPVMSAPMAMHSGGRLAAAVSQAGGLGTFGGINRAGPDWVREQIEYVRTQTDRPFGVGFITPFLQFAEELFAVAIEARVPVIVLSFADPEPWASRAKDAGARVICQVQDPEQAKLAVDAGADVLVAQGIEAGGHTGEQSLLPLLSHCAQTYPDLPLLAAGGISSGRALAAVLAAGAEGAAVGTPFLATPEAVEVPDAYKELIIASDAGDTTFTRVLDIVGGAPWPEWVGARVRRNAFVAEWAEREHELRGRRDEFTERYEEAEQARDTSMAAVYMGAGVGDVTAIRPAADVLRAICDDAERLLRERASDA